MPVGFFEIFSSSCRQCRLASSKFFLRAVVNAGWLLRNFFLELFSLFYFARAFFPRRPLRDFFLPSAFSFFFIQDFTPTSFFFSSSLSFFSRLRSAGGRFFFFIAFFLLAFAVRRRPPFFLQRFLSCPFRILSTFFFFSSALSLLPLQDPVDVFLSSFSLFFFSASDVAWRSSVFAAGPSFSYYPDPAFSFQEPVKKQGAEAPSSERFFLSRYFYRVLVSSHTTLWLGPRRR